MDRREFLKLAAASGGAALLNAAGAGPQSALGGEPMPVSPLILRPFRDPLPVPKPLAPSDPSTWTKPNGQPADPPDPARHQDWDLMGQPPVYYNIKVAYTPHRFTTSPVQGRDGRPASLPVSWMSTFNGTFPGSMIKAVYGQPCLVRLENVLNPDVPERTINGAQPWGDYARQQRAVDGKGTTRSRAGGRNPAPGGRHRNYCQRSSRFLRRRRADDGNPGRR